MSLCKLYLRRGFVALSVLMAIAAAPARADDATGDKVQSLGQIVVTAERRKELEQKVPVSVMVLSGHDLARLGAYNLNQYFKDVPGMNYAPTATGDRGGANIVIRGVSNTRTAGVDAAASANTTSFYLNDIPVTPIDLELFDVNRVEVLEGPQGTLFGAASMGGTIRILMNEPDSTAYEGQVVGQVFGRAGGTGELVQGMFNAPLVANVLAARLVVYQRHEDGFIDVIRPPLSDTTQNLTPSIPGYNVLNPEASGVLKRNTNTTQAEGARLALLFTPNSRLKIEPAFFYQDIKKGD